METPCRMAELGWRLICEVVRISRVVPATPAGDVDEDDVVALAEQVAGRLGSVTGCGGHMVDGRGRRHSVGLELRGEPAALRRGSRPAPDERGQPRRPLLRTHVREYVPHPRQGGVSSSPGGSLSRAPVLASTPPAGFVSGAPAGGSGPARCACRCWPGCGDPGTPGRSRTPVSWPSWSPPATPTGRCTWSGTPPTSGNACATWTPGSPGPAG